MLQLPPFGWKTHSEQSDPASVAANAFQMVTVLFSDIQVITVVLSTPPAQIARALEHVHAHQCGTHLEPHRQAALASLVGPDGKVKTGAVVYITRVVMPYGAAIATPEISLSPADAKKAHFQAVMLTVGGVTQWDDFQGAQA